MDIGKDAEEAPLTHTLPQQEQNKDKGKQKEDSSQNQKKDVHAEQIRKQIEVQTQEISTPIMDTETPMEEVRGDIYLKGLDLVSLEESCKNNTMHVITPKQIQLLTNILQSPNTRS